MPRVVAAFNELMVTSFLEAGNNTPPEKPVPAFRCHVPVVHWLLFVDCKSKCSTPVIDCFISPCLTRSTACLCLSLSPNSPLTPAHHLYPHQPITSTHTSTQCPHQPTTSTHTINTILMFPPSILLSLPTRLSHPKRQEPAASPSCTSVPPWPRASSTP